MKRRKSRRTGQTGQDRATQNRTRLDVIRRDRGVCQSCGMLGNEVHEIIPRSHKFKLLFDVRNRVVVCRWCHERAHTRSARIFLLKKLKSLYDYDYSMKPFTEYI